MPARRHTLALLALALAAAPRQSHAECLPGNLEVTVTVVDARVPDADDDWLIFVDDSDPYTLVQFGDSNDHVKETGILYDTLKPEWNEDLAFGCVPTTDTMKVSVYDWDVVNSDLVLYQEWADWAEYKNGVTRRLEDSLTADDDETNYYVDVIVSWVNTTGVGSPPTPSPTPRMVPTVHTTPVPTALNRFCNDPDLVPDCSGDGSCCFASWIGDGVPDCTSDNYYFYYSFYFCDLSCYDYDGGDCAPSVAPTQFVAPRPTQVPTVSRSGHHHHSSSGGTNQAGVAVGVSFAVVAGIVLILSIGVYYYRYSDGRALYGKLGGGAASSSSRARAQYDAGAMQGPSSELSSQGSSYTPPSMATSTDKGKGTAAGSFHDDEDSSDLVVSNPLGFDNNKDEAV